MRAQRIDEPLRIDGRLDEEIYQSLLPITGFIQQLPNNGEPATEETEVWLTFDRNNFYVSARCLDSQPEREIANEMRRDGGMIPQNENFVVVLDTFAFEPNQAVIFVKTFNSLHSVRPMTAPDRERMRRSLTINIEIPS